VIWLEPNDLAFDDAIRGVNVSREGDAVSSWHPQVAQVATLDCSVRVLRETDPPDLLERLLDCRDGRPIELGELER
jgi:hypothetical protein